MKLSFTLGLIAALLVMYAVLPFLSFGLTAGYAFCAAMGVGLVREFFHEYRTTISINDFIASISGGAAAIAISYTMK